uniref:Large ribosomal subunit protein uL15 n=1 Tax=Urocitellus parryii TaxID=9999 RepID=A0A8D2GQ90_UROPR
MPLLRKTRTLQGNVSHLSCGYGGICKHPGGCGNADGMYRHRINLDKHHPGYFGKTGAAAIAEVVRSGYYKVWGMGKLPKQPVIMKARFSSRRAEKIKGVGGA